MEYAIVNLTKEDAEYIGEKINGIVQREVDANKEEYSIGKKSRMISLISEKTRKPEDSYGV